eukprot:912571-Pyramimonas_sp.AAC.1
MTADTSMSQVCTLLLFRDGSFVGCSGGVDEHQMLTRLRSLLRKSTKRGLRDRLVRVTCRWCFVVRASQLTFMRGRLGGQGGAMVDKNKVFAVQMQLDMMVNIRQKNFERALTLADEGRPLCWARVRLTTLSLTLTLRRPVDTVWLYYFPAILSRGKPNPEL